MQATNAHSTLTTPSGLPCDDSAASMISTIGTTSTGSQSWTTGEQARRLATARRIIRTAALDRLLGQRADRGSRAGAASAGATRSCRRRRPRGDHQFHRPSSAISDGTSSERTMNASSSTPVATATPISWMKEIELVLNAPMATASRIAAAVTTRPVAAEPGGDGLALVGR